ncbi:MAG: cell wall hydrolase [Clostridia bacterium]|nr:cell wall hydrolase [Clostridia bacterium]
MPLIIQPEDAEYLIRAMAQECAGQEISYAARVGMTAVILNRVEDDRYPDTAAAVLAAWDAFTPADTPIPSYEQEYRLCTDAFRSAESGADPTGGALHFELLEPDVIHDSPFYTVIIDNVAFW